MAGALALTTYLVVAQPGASKPGTEQYVIDFRTPVKESPTWGVLSESEVSPVPEPVVVLDPTPAPTPTTEPAPKFTDNHVAQAAQDSPASGCPQIIIDTFGEEAGHACDVSLCESHWTASDVGDHGASLGIFQINTGWFRAGEDPFDLETNVRVALRVLQQRGHWGGKGGWTCADNLGIY